MCFERGVDIVLYGKKEQVNKVCPDLLKIKTHLVSEWSTKHVIEKLPFWKQENFKNNYDIPAKRKYNAINVSKIPFGTKLLLILVSVVWCELAHTQGTINYQP